MKGYDRETAQLLADLEAQGVVLIVVSGKRGHGCSFSVLDPALTPKLPQLLRDTADRIEQSMASGRPLLGTVTQLPPKRS